MVDLTPEEALKTLTQTEAYVLYWVCKGLPYKFIARNKVPFGVDMVQTHMSNVYSKLGIDNSMHALKRRKILEQVFCPALMKLCKGDPENIKKNWPPDDPNPRPDPRTLAIVIYEQGRQDAEEEQREEQEKFKKELANRGQVEIIDPNAGKSPKAPNYKVIGIVVFIVACIALAVGSGVTYYIVHNQPTQERIVPVIQTQLVAAPTNSPLPTYTFQTTQSSSPTFTPLPTQAQATTPPQPTNPPAPPTATAFVPPENGILFQDNFDKTISKEWVISSGTWLVSSGRLTMLAGNPYTDAYSWISLQKPEWKNYIFSINVYDRCTNTCNYMVFVLRDGSKRIGAHLNFSRHIYLALVGDGWDSTSPIVDDNRSFSFPENTNTTVEIEVQDNNYILRVNGREIQNITFPGNDSGGISIGVACPNGNCPTFDDVKVTYLP